jgi:hypothetical protein
MPSATTTRTVAILGLVALATLARSPGAPAGPPTPRNDSRARATGLAPPARVLGTTLGATADSSDPAFCSSAQYPPTVWYVARAPRTEGLVVTLDAGGNRDDVIAVFRQQRSHLIEAGCVANDASGQANISFHAHRGELFFIVVAPERSSDSGPFVLRLREIAPPATPPGKALPQAGAWGVLVPLLHQDAAWNAWLESGTTYRLASWTFSGRSQECPDVMLYRPPVRNFANPYKVVSCRGYFVFTPRPGTTGRWVVRIATTEHVAPALRYHLALDAATPDDTAPGLWLDNHAPVGGTLGATGSDRLDLYRFSARFPSELFASATLPVSSRADLVLMRDDGQVVRCACEGSGPQSMREHIAPGRYFLALRARGANSFAYTIYRLARMKTSTRVRLSGSPALPGAAVTLQATTVPPPRDGAAAMTIERFDPFAGWLFLQQIDVPVAANGQATLHYVPPAEGRYRASTVFRGSLSSSPSRGNVVAFVTQAPLDP